MYKYQHYFLVLSMKFYHEMFCLCKFLSMQSFFYEMSCLWNVLSIKCLVYEMACLWNVMSLKCLVYEMSCLWNAMTMKCLVYEMSCLWNFLILNVPKPCEAKKKELGKLISDCLKKTIFLKVRTHLEQLVSLQHIFRCIVVLVIEYVML